MKQLTAIVFAVVAQGVAAAGLFDWTGDTAKWMADIPDGTPVGRVFMPASHDAGMVEGHESHAIPDGLGIEGLFLNHDLTIGGQLAAGSRWFDLRPELHDGRILSVHRTDNDLARKYLGGAVGGCGEDYEQIFVEAVEFLKANPSEAVVFDIGPWCQTDDREEAARCKDAVLKMMADFDAMCEGGLFFRWTSQEPCPSINALPIGLARGKIIALLADTAPDPASGFFSKAGALGQSGTFHSIGGYANSDDLETMWADQFAKWERCAANHPDPTVCTYSMSWTLTWQFDVLDLHGSNRNLAARANPHLGTGLEEGVTRFGYPHGRVNLDYISASLCRKVIAYNFAEVWTAHPLNPSGDGAFVAPERTTEYLGTLVDPQARAAAGTVSVKVTKPDRRGLVTVTATVKTAADGHSFSYRAKGVALPEEGPLAIGLEATDRKSAAHTVCVVLGADSLSGTVDGTLEIDGARNVFKERKDPRRDALVPFAGTWNGWLSAAAGRDLIVFSAKVSANGSVSVKGWIGGSAFTCTSKAEVGEGVIAVPVVWRKKVKGEQVSLAFRLMLDLAGERAFVRDISREGFDFEDAGRPALDKAAFKALPVRVYPETGSAAALNAPSYAVKTGVISGSLKLSPDGRSKAKKAYGVVIGTAGVGTVELDGVRVLFRVGNGL